MQICVHILDTLQKQFYDHWLILRDEKNGVKPIYVSKNVKIYKFICNFKLAIGSIVLSLTKDNGCYFQRRITLRPGPRCIKLTIYGKLDINGNFNRILDADWLRCLVAMVVTIKIQLTINGKFYATGPRGPVA